MKGPMYDFFMWYIGILIFITLACIKEVRQEVKHIGYIFLLVICNVFKTLIRYVKDCFCKNKTATYVINENVNQNEFEQFELSDNNHTQYISL